MNKRLISMLTAIAISATLFVGCSGSKQETKTETSNVTETTESQEKIKVAYSTMGFDSPYWVEVGRGMSERGEELGWDVTIQDSKNDIGTQIAALENFIAQDYDVIFLSAIDSVACEDYVQKALDAGIIVLSQSTNVANEVAYCGPTEESMGIALGEAAGKWAAENLEGTVKGVTYYILENPKTVDREAAIIEGFEKHYPDVEWVGRYSSLTIEDGTTNFEGIVQAHPDVQVVLSCCDDGVMGSYEVAKSNNMDLDNMIFGGINALDQVLQMIKEEKEAGSGAYRVTVDIQPYQNGRNDIDFAQKLLETYESGEYETIMVQDAKAVTWDNIDEYFAG